MYFAGLIVIWETLIKTHIHLSLVDHLKVMKNREERLTNKNRLEFSFQVSSNRRKRIRKRNKIFQTIFLNVNKQNSLLRYQYKSKMITLILLLSNHQLMIQDRYSLGSNKILIQLLYREQEKQNRIVKQKHQNKYLFKIINLKIQF